MTQGKLRERLAMTNKNVNNTRSAQIKAQDENVELKMRLSEQQRLLDQTRLELQALILKLDNMSNLVLLSQLLCSDLHRRARARALCLTKHAHTINRSGSWSKPGLNAVFKNPFWCVVRKQIYVFSCNRACSPCTLARSREPSLSARSIHACLTHRSNWKRD